MRGADGTNAGASGYVPAPAATDNVKLLHGDGTFKAVSNASAATDAQASAGTSTTTFVTPANAKYAAATVVNPRAARQALAFDGTSYVTLANTAAFGTSDLAAFTWVNLPSLATLQGIFGGAANSLVLYVNSSGAMVSALAGVADNAASPALSVVVNTPALIGYSRSGTTGTYWVNGIAVGTTADSRNYSTANTILGKADASTYQSTGSISGPLYYNRALTAAEVLALYQEGAPRASDYGQGAVTTPTGGTYAYWFGTGSVTGGTATSFTLGAGASGCYVRNNVYVTPIVPGRYYRVTVTVTGTITGFIFFQGGANTVETPFSGTGSYILYAANITTTANPAFNLTSVAGGTVTVNSVTSLGLLCAPDANQPGRGTIWQDVSGNNADLTLPASGVRWGVPADTALTDVASVTAPSATNLTLAGGSSGASLALGQGTTSGNVKAVIPPTNTSPLFSFIGGPQTTNGAITRLSLGGYGFVGFESLAPGISAIQTGVTNFSHIAIDSYTGGSRNEVARFTNLGNVLIGGTTDISNSGGLKVFGTTTATNTTSGALQVAGGVGVQGAGYFGGNGAFGPSFTPQAWGTGGQLDVNGATGGILGLAYNGTAKGYVLAEAGGILVNSHAGGTAKFNTTGSGATTLGNSAGVTIVGDVALSTAGKTVSVKSGANALAGTVTLSGGAGTITSTAIDVNTVIVMTVKTVSGTVGDHLPSVSVAAGSATIDGSSSDNSTYNWVALKVS